MKVLVVGCGGIGSWLVEHISKAYYAEQIPFDVEIHIADFDSVDVKNVKYQNFTSKEVMQNKADALLKRFDFIAKAIHKKVDKKSMGNYDCYLICVDNFKARAEIIHHCHLKKKHFIDLRAEGRRVFAMSKSSDYEEDINTLDQKDKQSGSCQIPQEFVRNKIQYGNQIVAAIGIQMFLNYLRKEEGQNKILLKI